MPRKTKEIKISYVCKPFEEMSEKERLEAQARIDDIYDFVFTKTLEKMKKDKLLDQESI